MKPDPTYDEFRPGMRVRTIAPPEYSHNVGIVVALYSDGHIKVRWLVAGNPSITGRYYSWNLERVQ